MSVATALARQLAGLFAVACATLAAAAAQTPPTPAQPPSAAKPAAAPARPGTTLSAPAADAAAKPPAGALGDAFGGGHGGPLDIDAAGGFELQQDNKVYIARRDVHAKRGGVTLTSDTLYAYYRETGNGNANEIWRVVAEGTVTIATATQTIVGDKAVYDLDQAVVVITGHGLKLTTPQDVVTARDSIEWYDGKQLAVARGDAVAIRADRRLRADVLTADVVSGQGQPSRITRVDGKGNVLVSNTRSIGTGDAAVYNVDSGLATLAGHVKLTQGDNVLNGNYGVLDLNKNVSRLLPGPEAAGAPGGPQRVKGYIVPQQKGQTPPANPR